MSATSASSLGASMTAAIFWGGLLAGIFDITQGFFGLACSGRGPFKCCGTLPAVFLEMASSPEVWLFSFLFLRRVRLAAIRSNAGCPHN